MAQIRKYIRNILNELFQHKDFNANFWRWFGDSKIVENGKPQICYHGSPNSNVMYFDIKKAGSSTDSGMFGKGFYFTNDKKFADSYNRDGEGDTLFAYLSIKNPLIINNKEDIPEIEVLGESIEDMFNSAETYSAMFRSWLIKNNFDGVIDNISDVKQYVALYPNQIKATENDGSWDTHDKNIYS